MSMKEKPIVHSALGVCLSASMLLSGCGLVSYRPNQTLLGGSASGTVSAVKVHSSFENGETDLAASDGSTEEARTKRRVLSLVRALKRDFAESVDDISDLTKECSEKGTVVTLEYDTDAYIPELHESLHKSLMAYLPYGYDETKQYDVLYLLHGSSDYEDAAQFWLLDFGASTRAVLDNMIQRKLCKPVIVVCPTYYCMTEIPAEEEAPSSEASGTEDADNGYGYDYDYDPNMVWQLSAQDGEIPEEEEENTLSLNPSLVRTSYAPRILYAPEYIQPSELSIPEASAELSWDTPVPQEAELEPEYVLPSEEYASIAPEETPATDAFLPETEEQEIVSAQPYEGTEADGVELAGLAAETMAQDWELLPPEENSTDFLAAVSPEDEAAVLPAAEETMSPAPEEPDGREEPQTESPAPEEPDGREEPQAESSAPEQPDDREEPQAESPAPEQPDDREEPQAESSAPEEPDDREEPQAESSAPEQPDDREEPQAESSAPEQGAGI